MYSGVAHSFNKELLRVCVVSGSSGHVVTRVDKIPVFKKFTFQ